MPDFNLSAEDALAKVALKSERLSAEPPEYANAVSGSVAFSLGYQTALHDFKQAMGSDPFQVQLVTVTPKEATDGQESA